MSNVFFQISRTLNYAFVFIVIGYSATSSAEIASKEALLDLYDKKKCVEFLSQSIEFKIAKENRDSLSNRAWASLLQAEKTCLKQITSKLPQYSKRAVTSEKSASGCCK